MENDDFIELAPASAAKKLVSPIAFSTIRLRAGTEKVSFSFSAEAISKLEGWPRFSIAWSASSSTFRIRADKNGAFEAFKTKHGDRYILRVDLPKELKHAGGLKEPAPHRYGEDGKTVFVIAPPAFRRVPVEIRAPRPTSSHAAAVEAARQAAPAPNFSSRKV